jgi:uncharacterized membrane protein YciS (DUF1049 family)
MAAQQSFENHAKVVPAYHYFTFGLIAANLVYRLSIVATAFSLDAVMSLLLAVGVMMAAFWSRVFALRVQDRVIRLEMRLRLLKVAPAVAPRLGEFTINQLCSLRFASDAELPALAERVLAERLDDRKAIKRMIKDWEADLLRA